MGITAARAWQLVAEGMDRLNRDMAVDADRLRRETTEQIDQLVAAHMPAALAGDTKAAGVVLRALDSRAKLYGLVKTPVAQAVPAPNRYEQMSPEELRAEARKLGIHPPEDRPDAVAPYPPPAPTSTGPTPSTTGTAHWGTRF
jgi:hypothetical protein